MSQLNVESGSVGDLDDDRHVDQSESSDGHQGVEESDSSEDEVCSFVCFLLCLKICVLSFLSILTVYNLWSIAFVCVVVGGSSKYDWRCSIGVVSG